jgi:tryptophan-rich sensory protein
MWVKRAEKIDWAGLTLWVAVCVLGGAAIGVLTGGGDSAWYRTLNKPAWTPPSWLFAPVWTSLYAMMGIAAWRVWRTGGWHEHAAALTLFSVQLAVNFAWSPLFFTFQRIDLALADIVLLWLLIVATLRQFASIDRLSAWLLLPYLAWVSYATALNAAIAGAN